MHPVLIVVPVLGGVFGPRLWAKAQLRRYDVEDSAFLPAADLARRLLDRHGLTLVRVEVTDLGDHYDPVAKAVRINRARFERASLTAATTVAHEVGHALQDASGHWAFRLHRILARVAQVTTGVGSALLLAVPVAAVAAQTPAQPRALGFAAAAMLGTGLAAQLAALPSELDASFGRALPLLRECCIADGQQREARRILLACSLTYVASAAVPALALWPWLGPRLGQLAVVGLVSGVGPGARAQPQRTSRVPARLGERSPRQCARGPQSVQPKVAPAGASWEAAPRLRPFADADVRTRPRPKGQAHVASHALLRTLARPLVRKWLLVTGDY
jgi:hypothetical protein